MKIFLDVDELTNVVKGWGSSPISNNPIEIEIEDYHEFIFEPICELYTYVDGELIKNDESVLKMARDRKSMELNNACNNSILAGFKHNIGGIEYHFSFDQEAQMNFQGVKEVLSDDIVSEIMWTVRKNGEYTRIPINKAIMNELTIAILLHKDSNISKYRDFLMPLVNSATTVEEINAIKW
jgi:hypothetical protein